MNEIDRAARDAAIQQTVDEHLSWHEPVGPLFVTFAPHYIDRLTFEFWLRPHRGRRFYGFGGCLFWTFILVAYALSIALKLGVYLLAVALVLAAQLVSWGADLFMLPFRVRQRADAHRDRLAGHHAR